MPYDVSGWIEVLWEYSLEEEHQAWCSLMSLDIFGLYGDIVSNSLFGLAKTVNESAPFIDRGVPSDCSHWAAQQIENNEKFIEQYGEGNFGHTYALWSEILEHLEKIESITPDWELIFSIIQQLTIKGYNPLKPEYIRLIVWGNW